MIEAENLQKYFNDPKTKQIKRAVDGVSFATKPGEIFGLLARTARERHDDPYAGHDPRTDRG
jgi:ABC-type Na+ transport system ATPase subunit NatA